MSLKYESELQRALLTHEIVAFNKNLGELSCEAWNLCANQDTRSEIVGRAALLYVPILFMPMPPRLPRPDMPIGFGLAIRRERYIDEDSIAGAARLGNFGETYEDGSLANVTSAEIKRLLELHRDGELNRLWPTMFIEPSATKLPAPLDGYNGII